MAPVLDVCRLFIDGVNIFNAEKALGIDSTQTESMGATGICFQARATQAGFVLANCLTAQEGKPNWFWLNFPCEHLLNA